MSQHSFILGDIPNSGGNFTDLPTSKDQKLRQGKVKAKVLLSYILLVLWLFLS